MATESWVISGPQVIEVDAIDSLVVELIKGSVDVVVADGTGARLEVFSVSGRPLEVTLGEGRLHVGYHFLGWERSIERMADLRADESVEIHLAVPATTPVKLSTVKADALVSGLTADVSVNTVSGTVVVDGVHGRVSTNQVSGEIVVRDHDGDLKVNSVSGSATVAGAITRISATTVAGDITVDQRAATSTVKLNTVSGDMTVRLPEWQGLNLKARGVGGRVVVDGQEQTAGARFGISVDLGSGGPGCWLETKTVGGSLTVVRQAAG